MNILKNLFLTDFIQIMGPLKSENMSFTIHMFSFPYICYMPNLDMIAWLYVVSKKNSNKFKSLLKHVFDITIICIGQLTTTVSNRICPVIKTKIILTL